VAWGPWLLSNVWVDGSGFVRFDFGEADGGWEVLDVGEV
jgi:hypothetical protein